MGSTKRRRELWGRDGETCTDVRIAQTAEINRQDAKDAKRRREKTKN